MKKRVLASLLALCMVMTLLPVTALAEEDGNPPTTCTQSEDCTAETHEEGCPRYEAPDEPEEPPVEEPTAAELAAGMIEALPDYADVTPEDIEAIKAAKAAYDALSDEEKAELNSDLLATLDDLVELIPYLENDCESSNNTAAFGEIAANESETFTISISTDNNKWGTVMVDKMTASVGSVVTLTITPKNGYSVWASPTIEMINTQNTDTYLPDTVSVEVNKEIENTFTFSMPENDVHITSVFYKITDGTLHLGGSGQMTGNPLTDEEKSSIAEVRFDNDHNITALSSTAFWNLTNEQLGVFLVPKSVVFIGWKTFANSNFTGVQFEDGSNLKAINSYTWQCCSRLTGSFAMPDSVLTFGGSIIDKTNITSFSYHGKATGNCPTTNTNSLKEIDISGSALSSLTLSTVENAPSVIVNIVKCTNLSSIVISNGVLYTSNEITVQRGNNNMLAVTNGGTFADGTIFTTDTLATPIKEGYTFGGWYDNDGFTGQTVATPEAGKTYYAKWVSKITFEGNGATDGTMTAQEITEGSFATLTTNGFTKTGYTFTGWNTAPDGNGTSYANEAAAPATSTTLYAQWTPNQYAIHFSGGAGASGETASIYDVSYDTSVHLTANGFTKEGKNFAGWSTEENADAAMYADGERVSNLTDEADGSVTLYAVWTDKAVLNPDTSVQTKTYNGAAQAFELKGGFDVTYQQDGEAVAAPTNAGRYDVSIYHLGDDTYAPYLKKQIPGGLVINPAPLTISANSVTIHVGEPLPDYAYTVTGWQGTDNDFVIAPTVTCDAPDSSATGAYAITASGADAGANYLVTYVPGTLRIVEKNAPVLQITPSVTELSGGGTVKLTVSGVPEGGTVTVTQTDDQGSESKTLDLTGNGEASVELSNKDAKYTFTVSFAGDGENAAATAACEVTVTYKRGSSSSSSGGSSSSTTSSKTDAAISTGSGTVSASQMTSAVRQAKQGSTVTVKATGSDMVSLPVSGLQAAAENDNDVAVTTQNGAVVLSAAALEGLTEGASATAAIAVAVEPQSGAAHGDAAAAALLSAGAPVFDVAVTVDGKAVHSFDGALTITLTVPGLDKIQDPRVLHLLSDGSKEYYTPAIDGNQVTVKEIRKLSVFAVIPASEVPAALPFTDVSEGFWGYDAIVYVYEHGLFAGTTATTFSPDRTMTREMLWTVLGRLSGEELTGSGVYEKARQWAVSTGVSDGANGADTITREQMVTMLYRYAGSPAVSGSLNAFTDASDVSGYARNAMIWAVENGIVSGVTADTLSPQGGATRAQVAAILMRFQENTAK